MTTEYIRQIIKNGEGVDVELKESKTNLNKNIFQTVCSFLNRNGGHLILGINDNGNILGINNPEKLINEFNTLANNPQKPNPTFYFHPEILEIGNKQIVYIFIPESSQVHRTNLIESYDKLMAFIKKHLPDPFYLEDDKRVSLRNKIFREAITNILIHREFINPFPAKMIIEPGKVIFENASRPHSYGLITPDSFSPFPKNPNIARVFKEIGLADELGSGVRNLYKYSKIYSNTDPEITEGDIFKIIIAIPKATMQAPMQAIMQVENHEERTVQIIEFCKLPKTREEVQTFLNLKNRDYFRKEILNPLLEQGILQMTIPEKPNSPKQKYYSTIREDNQDD